MASASSPSPRPAPIFAASPTPSQHSSTTSPTPPPRPPSSPGISVFAPRPMRVPIYRPQFSRPVFLYDSDADNNKENPPASSTRRSSVASITGIPEDAIDPKILYIPSKDVLEELFKIVRPTSASSSTGFARPQPLHPRSPNAAAAATTSHRRNPSDASDSGLSNILGGLSVLSGSGGSNPTASPDAEWRHMRTAVSPVARRTLGNPMIRDPSFHGEPKREP
ncbi:hypothetical protein DRE_03368 [Drechslerella stenobrocha 248]|uniref:Uncharacterized protein n=1 Tax=Drechslerella stenobrocha 248 TaxID=1043628 RepID=W7HUQ6_9PEZI|nr:hypothetical protein DRE_03368 [Drechslerella stenobrocha 248]